MIIVSSSLSERNLYPEMDFSRLHGYLVPPLSRERVFEVEYTAAHADVYARAESERRVKQVVVVALLLIDPSVEEEVHVGVPAEQITELGGVQQVGAGVELVLREPADLSLPANLEHFMQTVNSYLGLLGWCNTARLRHEIVESIKAGPYGKAFLFSDDDHKINIKPSYTRTAHYIRKNKQRKKSLKLWVM